MANTTANNNEHDEFDEDLELDNDFIDDFDKAPDAKRDGLGTPIRLERAGSAPANVKNILNLLIIGTIGLALVYFGYSYYKKSSNTAHKKETLPTLNAPASMDHHAEAQGKLIDASHPSNVPAIHQGQNPVPTGTASIANAKIEDLQFELTTNNKDLDNKAKDKNTQTLNSNNTSIHQNNDAKVLADHANNAKIDGLDQALAPSSVKVLKPVEDLFDNDVVANNKPAVAHTTTEPSKNNDYIKDTLASMAEEITLNVNHIQQLESTVTQINKTLEHLTQALTKLDSKLSDVTAALSSMDQDVNNIKKVISNQDLDLASMPNKISSSKRDPLVYSTPDYVVHAIIPGRAWLKSTSGQIITITEGDSLGDFGKVAAIDATNNLVRTSSGITFR